MSIVLANVYLWDGENCRKSNVETCEDSQLFVRKSQAKRWQELEFGERGESTF